MFLELGAWFYFFFILGWILGADLRLITHVKEKLDFVNLENTCKKSQLLEIEAQVALGRDILTKTKQTRDSLRIDNIKLNQKCGLLGKESLLQDMEEKVDKTNLLNRRLESLKRHHAGLTLSCRGMKQKVREAKAFLPSWHHWWESPQTVFDLSELQSSLSFLLRLLPFFRKLWLFG